MPSRAIDSPTDVSLIAMVRRGTDVVPRLVLAPRHRGPTSPSLVYNQPSLSRILFTSVHDLIYPYIHPLDDPPNDYRSRRIPIIMGTIVSAIVGAIEAVISAIFSIIMIIINAIATVSPHSHSTPSSRASHSSLLHRSSLLSSISSSTSSAATASADARVAQERTELVGDVEAAHHAELPSPTRHCMTVPLIQTDLWYTPQVINTRCFCNCARCTAITNASVTLYISIA
ncbi:uncharacterized protein LAESUDRAFT_47599 [Laetiporus sulphureus 93-53]|uniref:Uncharacterized protein n=1 Tax=Laetiporus sulphureus 93-53 TaxID=1314785 RepID=A0A165FA06_9APHY|nr:uncharacterized protein LAESUDRAFT_47599 [Laetiporus sulphureus 93-53]KZT08657.1 hypothetical protein LAESUDRAFT_47599 [Laetiporus sulphureus 93-53]